MKFASLFQKKNTPPTCSAVIVAAGSSTRMGEDKLLAELGGMPVLVRTLRTFENSDLVDEIVVVTRMDRVQYIADVCYHAGFKKVTKVIAGGKTRMESALIGVSATAPNAMLIAIHDAARPLLTTELIERTVRAAAQYRAAVPVVPSVDTLKVIDENNLVAGTVDRNITYRVQTPQVFDATLIKGALTKATEKHLVLTDDCAAMDMMGVKTYAVAGEEDNIKLTTPRDLILAEAILKSKEEI